MRAWRQEGAIAGPEPDRFSPAFWPAIPEDADFSRPREAWWHAVRFDQTRVRAMERVLGLIGLDYRLFTYVHRRPRRAPVTRSWLPGYFFAEFDERDGWRQLHNAPGVIQVLGTPLPQVVIEDLALRLPQRLGPAGEFESVAPGTRVRVMAGTFRGRVMTVTWSERRRVKVVVVMFERPTEVELRTRDVEVVGA